MDRRKNFDSLFFRPTRNTTYASLWATFYISQSTKYSVYDGKDFRHRNAGWGRYRQTIRNSRSESDIGLLGQKKYPAPLGVNISHQKLIISEFNSIIHGRLHTHKNITFYFLLYSRTSTTNGDLNIAIILAQVKLPNKTLVCIRGED